MAATAGASGYNSSGDGRKARTHTRELPRTPGVLSAVDDVSVDYSRVQSHNRYGIQIFESHPWGDCVWSCILCSQLIASNITDNYIYSIL